LGAIRADSKYQPDGELAPSDSRKRSQLAAITAWKVFDVFARKWR
jgi:hypothetical protein